jgi:hypothetical protein
MTSKIKSKREVNVRVLWGEIFAVLNDACLREEIRIGNREFNSIIDIGMAVTARHIGKTLVDDDGLPVEPHKYLS